MTDFEENLKNEYGKIGIITGGMSSEREVSLATAESVESALSEMGFDYEVIYAEDNFVQRLLNCDIETAFIAMHGGKGENGSIQGLLETMGIPYTGSGILASSVCMNKAVSKSLFEYHGISTPKWQILNCIDDLNLDLPLVFKPICGGSTIGITIVKDNSNIEEAFEIAYREALNNNDSQIMVEAYIPGRELTVGLLDGQALPVLEIESMTEFYDYEAKYETGKSKHYPPESLDAELYNKLQSISEKVFRVMNCSGMARVDFRLNNNEYYVLEINTIPGLTKTSLLPEAAELTGMGFNSLVLKILEIAKKKAQRKELFKKSI